MLVSVYIRKSDEEKWRNLENKTAAISKLLNANTSSTNTISTPKIKKELLKIDGVSVASEAECPRHHVPYKICEQRH